MVSGAPAGTGVCPSEAEFGRRAIVSGLKGVGKAREPGGCLEELCSRIGPPRIFLVLPNSVPKLLWRLAEGTPALGDGVHARTNQSPGTNAV